MQKRGCDGRREDRLDLLQCRHNPLSPLFDSTSAPQPGGAAFP